MTEPKPKEDKIDRTKPAAIIAAKFGGLSALAKAFDPPKSPSTCHRWLESGRIPSIHHEATMEAAKRLKVKLSPKDFFPAQ